MGWSGYAGDSVPHAQQLLARAKAGDQAAINQLYIASRSGGWRPDHRNAAIDAWNAVTPDTSDDLPHMKNPHGFLGDVGKFIGGGLKKLAPLAAFIPGVGPFASGGIAALANTGGSLMRGEGVDFGGSLKDALLAGAGNKFLAPHKAPPEGNVQPADSLFQAGGVMQGMPAAPKPGIPQQLLDQFKNPDTGQLDFGKLAQVGGAGLGIMEKRQQRNTLERLYNSQAAAQQAQTRSAEQDYANKSGIRSEALKRLGNMQSSSIFGAR